MNRQKTVLLSLAASAVLIGARPTSAASCESLAALSLPHVTVTLANLVEAGTFVQFPAGRGGGGAPTSFSDLRAFCRVIATLTPTSDSDIRMELWMPVRTSWNGKLRGTGNGGL